MQILPVNNLESYVGYACIAFNVSAPGAIFYSSVCGVVYRDGVGEIWFYSAAPNVNRISASGLRGIVFIP